MKTSKRIHNLHQHAKLPEITLTTTAGKQIRLPSAIKNKTVLFFGQKMPNHMPYFAHKKNCRIKD